MEYSGAGGKLIHEKNQKQKISWHCPFKERQQQQGSLPQSGCKQQQCHKQQGFEDPASNVLWKIWQVLYGAGQERIV